MEGIGIREENCTSGKKGENERGKSGENESPKVVSIFSVQHFWFDLESLQ